MREREKRGRKGGRVRRGGRKKRRNSVLTSIMWGGAQVNSHLRSSDTELNLQKRFGAGEGVTYGAPGRKLISDLVHSSPSLRGHDSRNVSLSCATQTLPVAACTRNWKVRRILKSWLVIKEHRRALGDGAGALGCQ